MTGNGQRVVRLEFTSAVEMLDFVQVVSDHVGRTAGLDDDAIHWVGVAIRESVINAIRHGNRNDESKHVFVEFHSAPAGEESALTIFVRDQGEGFDPETVANPLEPDNLLKSSGRGIFLIRNFMDEVHLQRAAEGGMVCRMVKRLNPAESPADSAPTSSS
jgi:serine/threonine-protein kinase RsbW